MKNRGATIIAGAQWGDEGKGLISAYLGMRDNPRYVVRAGTGPNAEPGKAYNKIIDLAINKPILWDEASSNLLRF